MTKHNTNENEIFKQSLQKHIEHFSNLKLSADTFFNYHSDRDEDSLAEIYLNDMEYAADRINQLSMLRNNMISSVSYSE